MVPVFNLRALSRGSVSTVVLKRVRFMLCAYATCLHLRWGSREPPPTRPSPSWSTCGRPTRVTVRAVLEHQRAELDLMMAVAGIATIGEIVQTCWGPR